MIEQRHGGVPDLCFLCGGLSFGLKGQDYYLAPCMLGARDKIGQSGPGLCHLKCLRDSGLGGAWARGVANYAVNRWNVCHKFHGGAWRVYPKFAAKELFVWSALGWFVDLKFEVVRGFKSSSGVSSFSFVVESAIGYEGGPYQSVFPFHACGGSSGRVDLLGLLEQTGSLDRVLDRAALEGGWVGHFQGRKGKNFDLPSEYRAHYNVVMPADVAAGCEEIARKSGGITRRRR